jgi:hypothetical protein
MGWHIPFRKSRGRFGPWNPTIRSISYERCWRSLMVHPIPAWSRPGLTKRRSHELDAGVIETIPAEEVFAKARVELKRR